MTHSICLETVTLAEIPLRERRKQRLLAATVRTIANADRQHSPEALARFIVYVMAKQWPAIPAWLRSTPEQHFTPARRRWIIRHQFRLRGRLMPLQSQTLRRYDRVLRAVIYRDELQRDLLRLLGAGMTVQKHHQRTQADLPRILLRLRRGGRGVRENVRRTRRALELLFQHTASQGCPSLEASIEDIRTLNSVGLREIHRQAEARFRDRGTKATKDEVPAAIERAVVEASLRAFRAARKRKEPSTAGEADKGRSFDVLDRRVRRKLRVRDGLA